MISIRGAITAENNRETMLDDTENLLKEILVANDLEQEDIIQITFTATKDLDAVYPAVAARTLGIKQASLLCMQEMYVEGSLAKCIRVMVLAESDIKQRDVKHIYLKEAQSLRKDLVK